MANNSALINYITSAIRSNGNQEITGDILQEVLLDIVNRLGYQFAGIAKPTTEPPLYPDANIWYLASAAGTYTNFNGVVLDGNTLVAFVWNGEWTSHPLIDCNIEIDSGVSEEWVNNKLLEVLAPLIVKIDNAYNLFDIDDNGNIYVKKDADGNPRTLWNYGDIVAGGNSEGEDPSTLTTIGELVNVADNADDIYSIDKVLIKLANSTEWTLADLSSLVGLDEQALASYLTTNNYAKKSDIEEAIKQTDVAKLTTRVTTIEQTLADWFEFDAENGKLYLKKDANGNVRHFVSYGDVIAGGDSEGGTSSLTVGYQEVITSDTGVIIGYLLVNDNSIPIYAPLGGGTASNVEWANVLNKPTTLPNPKALTVGSKSYDGSSAITITASDLGAITSLDGYVNEIATTGSGNAITSVSKSGKVITFTKGTTFLTSHQTLYALTIKNSAGTTQLTYTPNSAAGSITLTKAMVGLGNVENTALSTWAGSSYITKVGTISSGVWQGTAIANAYVANLPISKITNLQTTLDSKLSKATFDDIFELDSTNGKLYLKKDSSGNVRHFVAYGDIIAGGDSEGGETPTTSIDWSALAAATTEQINISHLTDALSNYVTTSTLSNYLLKSELSTISVGNADTLDGYHASSFARKGVSYNSDAENNAELLSGIYGTTDGTTTLPYNEVGNTIIRSTWDSNAANELFLAFSLDYVGFRRKRGGTWYDWKQIAFTDSNVASATKLQTARSIWGQSFDGTSDVDGRIAINSDAVLERKSSAVWLNYGPANKNENLYLFGYNTQLYYGTASGYRLAIDIKPTGNVLIGTTDDSGAKLNIVGGRVLIYDSNRRTLNNTCIADSALLHLTSLDTNNDGLFIGHRSDGTSWIQSAFYGTSTNPSSNHTYPISLNPLGGNILIGATTDNGYKLDVNGSFNAATIYQNGTTLDNTYLKLSGGTIEVSNVGNFNVYNNSQDLSVIHFYALKNDSKTDIGYLGVTANYEPIYMTSGGTRYPLIHSGNISSQSVNYATSAGSADTLDNINSTGFARIGSYPTSSTTNWSMQSGIYQTYAGTSDLPLNGVGNHVIHCNWDQNAANQIFLSFNTDLISFRRKSGNVWQDWKTIAFTDSNVASATYATSAGSATTASKLTTNAGDSTTPVYFSGGVPVACDPYSAAFVSYATTSSKLTDSSLNALNVGSSTQPVYFSGGKPVVCTEYASAAVYSATKLADNTDYSAWGRTFFSGGKPATSFAGGLYGVTTINNVINISDSDYVGIGIASPAYKLDVSGQTRIASSSYASLRVHRTLNAAGYGSAIAFSSDYNELGTIGWNQYDEFKLQDDRGNKFFYGGVNGITVGTSLLVTSSIVAYGEITAGSDIRYKSIQNDVILDTKAIANAPIFDFRWTDREDDKLHLGTSAQYWLDYAPNAVTNSNDFYSLNYGVLGVAIGVSNAKKLLSHEERIEQLEKENKQLRNELNQLRYGIE